MHSFDRKEFAKRGVFQRRPEECRGHGAFAGDNDQRSAAVGDIAIQPYAIVRAELFWRDIAEDNGIDVRVRIFGS